MPYQCVEDCIRMWDVIYGLTAKYVDATGDDRDTNDIVYEAMNEWAVTAGRKPWKRGEKGTVDEVNKNENREELIREADTEIQCGKKSPASKRDLIVRLVAALRRDRASLRLVEACALVRRERYYNRELDEDLSHWVGVPEMQKALRDLQPDLEAERAELEALRLAAGAVKMAGDADKVLMDALTDLYLIIGTRMPYLMMDLEARSMPENDEGWTLIQREIRMKYNAISCARRRSR